ncbi:hypothetical protein G6F46_000905 [Rhizopus delemar]|nr:hypothetical protein G6F55_004267 [Rhizopus delemar]KAG1550239.1 hypothetical protein G6F51_002555 [Rhizopus arrhizus]KAG1493434.1 hypothetical protein G6F54_008578 [Rhizopus delemar]KAG1512191.1 hypothetical protein G6F53_005368 [Rhizopus delemar]KAG1522538.1 hypothetical protein G6F52_005775 [Rhizopus delemar]
MNSIVLDKKVEQICLSVGVLTAAIVLFKATTSVFSNKSRNGIPLVPYKIPFVGSTMAYYKNMLEFTKKHSEKYGSVFHMHLHGQIITVVGADDAPEAFTHPDLSFLAGQVEFLGEATASKSAKKDVLPASVIKTSIVKHLTPNLDHYAPQSFEMLCKKAKSVLDAEKGIVFVYPNAVSINKHRTLIKTALKSEIERNNGLDKKEPSNILEFILDQYPAEIDDDYLEALTTTILIFIFVGVHTTSMAVAQVLYRLVKHPEYTKELIEEQQEVLKSGYDSSAYSPSAYRQMVKLDSFIRESLRTRSNGIGLPHKNITNQDIVLRSGAIVHPGENVYINMWHVNTNEVNQENMKDTEQFQGFRFVGRDKPSTKPGHDFISFGLGRRSCPGRWFAIQQIKGIISFLILNYDISAASEIKIPGVDSYAGSLSGSIQFQKKI